MPDQSARVSRYCSRTSSTCSPSSSTVQPSVGIGGSTRTCTVPALDRRRPAPHQLARVADDDRHDRHPGLHRDVEGALLERAERGRRRPGALRRDHQRDALPQPLAPRARAPAGPAWCCRGRRRRRRRGGTSARTPASFAASFFATPVKPPRSSLARTSTSSWLWWLNRNTAGRARQVLGALHVEPHPGQRAAQLAAPARCPRSTAVPAGAVQRPQRDARVRTRRASRRCRPPCGASSREPGRGRAAGTARPASVCRARVGQPAAGVERARRGRRCAGTGRPRRRWSRRSSRQVDAVLRARTPAPPSALPARHSRRPAGAPGADAVLDLAPGRRARARRPAPARPAPPGSGSPTTPAPRCARRRRCAVDQPPRLRVERPGDALHEQPLAELGELVLAAARPGPHAERRRTRSKSSSVVTPRRPVSSSCAQVAPG